MKDFEAKGHLKNRAQVKRWGQIEIKVVAEFT